jgi:trans-2-enoyl-CoA reductase
MLTLLQSAYGNPADVLELVDAPPHTPADDEIVLRMEAAAVHLADVYTILGRPGFERPLPRTPGYEGVGRVVRIGERVREFKEGDRVFAGIAAGTYAEEVKIPAGRAIPAPDGDALQLALLTINPPTALLMLEDYVELDPGDWVLQNAANSSVGRYLIVLARRRGLRTVNVVRRPSLVEELRALGADAVVLDAEDLPERVAAATDNAAIRLGIDAVAGDATGRIAACLAEHGVVVNYGSVTREPCHMPFDVMFWKDVTLRGFSTTRQLAARSAGARVDLYRDLASLVADGTLRAKIAASYPLSRCIDAFEHALRTGEERDGKVVITMP